MQFLSSTTSTEGTRPSIRIDEGVEADNYDFDHPESLDFDSVYECLKSLTEKKITNTPVYCFKMHKRKQNEHHTIQPKRFVILEGILAFYDEVSMINLRESETCSISKYSFTAMLT